MGGSMFETAEAFMHTAKPSIEQFDRWAHDLRFAALADHLGYKCISSHEFEHIRHLFERADSFMYQSIISGRRVAIIKLPSAVRTSFGDIWYLELSDQKPDGSQDGRFDHIEIYPAFFTVENMVKLVERNGTRFTPSGHAHHKTYDITLENGFKVRLEPEPLIKKIIRDEMK
jgi:predicted metalloenzyme YecM